MAKRENICLNEAYKAYAIKAIRKIKVGRRIQQIYTIAKKMAESEGVDIFKSANPSDADDFRDEIESLVGQI